MTKKLFLLCVSIILSACGIEGVPLSPAQVQQDKNHDTLLPFGKKDVTENKNNNQKQFMSIAELNNVGHEYSANFGIENQELEDIFERIMPRSGQPRRRIVVPLRKMSDYE